MSSESLKPEKKEERKGTEESTGDISVKWWSEKLWLAESTRSPSLPVVVPGPGSSLNCLRRWKERVGECEEGSYQRGLSHCVEVTPQKTCWPPQWTVSPQSSPWGGRVSMASNSHTRVSACLAADLYATVLSLTPVDSPLTALACLKTLFVQLLQSEVDSLFCFCGEIFPHHTTVPIPQPWVSRTKEASVSLTLPLELKDEKPSFHSTFPAQSFSPHFQRSPFSLFTVIIYFQVVQDVFYCRSCTLLWLVCSGEVLVEPFHPSE